jgi:CheY-like chemotaxis protein
MLGTDSDSAALKNRTTILLAEDDPDDVELIRAAFNAASMPYRLQVVTNGEETLQYLKHDPPYADTSRYPTPFILLLDLKMPVRSGFEVLDWIRSRREFDSLLVVILTGSALPSDVGKANQLGTNCYLVKSSDYKQLTLFLKSFVAGEGSDSVSS